MNGGDTSLQRPFPSNVFFCFPNMSESVKHTFGIVFKLGELGNGPLSLCMNFVGLEPNNMIVSVGNKLSLVKGSPKVCQNIKMWHLLSGHYTLDYLD